MKCAEKTASIVAAFALAATAFTTPMPAQAEGFFDDLKAGVKQGLERRGNQGGMEGAIAGGLNAATKSAGDKTTELTGVKSAAQPIPTWVGRTVTGETRVCYTQDPNEKPQYFGNAMDASFEANSGGEAGARRSNTRRAFAGTPGNGGFGDAISTAADIAQTIATTCGAERAAGRMQPYGPPKYGSAITGRDRLVHVSAHNKCSGEPADDWNETRDRMVMPRGMGELDKYGPYPIMRCNQTTGLYGPITSNDPQSPWNPAGSFIPKSKELAAAENIKVQKELAKMMAEYEEDRLDPTARVRRGTSSYDPAGTLNDPMRKRGAYGGKAFVP
ncbi:MAG: hypothetical protein WBK77_07205 [Alphaproteobacteria bacterium]